MIIKIDIKESSCKMDRVFPEPRRPERFKESQVLSFLNNSHALDLYGGISQKVNNTTFYFKKTAQNCRFVVAFTDKKCEANPQDSQTPQER